MALKDDSVEKFTFREITIAFVNGWNGHDLCYTLHCKSASNLFCFPVGPGGNTIPATTDRDEDNSTAGHHGLANSKAMMVDDNKDKTNLVDTVISTASTK